MPDQEDTRISYLLKQIEVGGGGGYGIEAAKAEIETILAKRLTHNLVDLSNAIGSAQQIIGTRLSELNAELKSTRDELRVSSTAATKHARSLSVATWALVGATVALGVIAWLQVTTAERSMKVQVSPEVRLEVLHTGEIVLGNEGTDQVVNLSVTVDSITLAGPPVNKVVFELRNAPPFLGEKSTLWWHLDRLEAGEVKKRSMTDIIENVFKARQLNTQAQSKRLPQLHTLFHIYLTYHRVVDLKRYVQTKTVVAEPDSNTGKPIVFDNESLRFLAPSLGEALEKLSKERQQYR